jgi:hypothetical protein
MWISTLLLTISVLFSPCLVQVVRAESAIAGSEQSQEVRVIETEGQGRTPLEARKAAVTAAIEQAVGVYIDSRRRLETQLFDKMLREFFEEQIQTHRSAFVKKVETLSSEPDGQGGSIVRLRSYVVVPKLLNAQDAHIPFAPVDAPSHQTNSETLEEKEKGAAEIFVTQFEELPKKIRIEVVPGSIKWSLSQIDQRMAILRGQLSVAFDTSGLKNVYDAFRTYTDVQPPAGFSKFIPSAPRKAFVCISNLLEQVTACRGEDVDVGRAAQHSRSMYIKAILRFGKEEFGTIWGLVNFKCVDFEPRFRWQPSYFEASSHFDPDSLEFQNSAEWSYFDDAARSKYPAADFESSSIAELSWGKSHRDPRLLSLRITSVPVDAGTTQDTRLAELRARMPAQSVCSFSDQQQGWRLLISGGSAPLTRYFYIVGPKQVIGQVDEIGFLIETE